jgi:CheY-like chemotaxis protein
MKTVLTVDPSQVVRAVVERHLERFDCRMIEATTADEAIAVVHADAPDLVLVEAAVHAAASRGGDARYVEVPVVLLTTDHPASIRLRDDPCVVAALRKPFDRASFDGAVAKVLGTPRGTSPTMRVAQGAAR